MGCNRDDGCLNIARNTYPNLLSGIDNSTLFINNQINDVIEELNSLIIPNDYLGNKVKEKLDEINENLNNDVSELNTFKNNINSFIEKKIKEHEKHYIDWQNMQEKKDNQE